MHYPTVQLLPGALSLPQGYEYVGDGEPVTPATMGAPDAFEFQGNCIIAVPETDIKLSTDDFTYEIVTKGNEYFTYFATSGYPNTAKSFRAYYYYNRVYFQWRVNDWVDWNWEYVPKEARADVNHHVIVKEGDTVKIYVNSALVYTFNLAVNPEHDKLYLGGYVNKQGLPQQAMETCVEKANFYKKVALSLDVLEKIKQHQRERITALSMFDQTKLEIADFTSSDVVEIVNKEAYILALLADGSFIYTEKTAFKTPGVGVKDVTATETEITFTLDDDTLKSLPITPTQTAPVIPQGKGYKVVDAQGNASYVPYRDGKSISSLQTPDSIVVSFEPSAPGALFIRDAMRCQWNVKKLDDANGYYDQSIDWKPVPFNRIVNKLSGMAVSDGVITFPVGTYYIEARAFVTGAEAQQEMELRGPNGTVLRALSGYALSANMIGMVGEFTILEETPVTLSMRSVSGYGLYPRNTGGALGVDLPFTLAYLNIYRI